jgi:signal transduction histidine kinase
MKIRTRLALYFTIIVASLLIFFALAIYYFSSTYRQKEFYERLSEKAFNYGKLVIEVDEVSADLMNIFDKNTAYLTNERIIIYDHSNRQIFITAGDKANVDEGFIEKIRTEKEMRYMDGDNEALAKAYPYKDHLFVVMVSAYDKDGLNKLDNLKIILLIGSFVSVIITMLVGWIYSGQVLSPISGVIRQVEKTTVSNLSERIDIGNGKDEIGQLATTFNGMLERIQRSFELQKGFVSNSSHELRTPLTAITGQLEVALMSKRDPEEYIAVLHSILEDIRNVNRLTNGLLELAQTDADISHFKMRTVRVDELLWQTRDELLKRNPGYKITIDVSGLLDDERKLQVMGSEHLLKSALMNIMDNACKFSFNKQVDIVFGQEADALCISFTDKGIGISEEDLKQIKQPFFRAANAKTFPGHGLGLSLTYKIVSLHKGSLEIDSRLGDFTKVDLILPVYSGSDVRS